VLSIRHVPRIHVSASARGCVGDPLAEQEHAEPLVLRVACYLRSMDKKVLHAITPTMYYLAAVVGIGLAVLLFALNEG